MVSREHSHKRGSLHEKLQLLRSITNSHAVSESSIITDASKYIAELKHKVERLNEDIATTPTHQDPSPKVRIETLEKGFVINVLAAKSCPGLLVSLLEAFDGMDLDVQQARVSCTHTFRFQALATQNKEEEGMSMDAQDVKQAVGQAIKKWRESSSHDEHQ